MIVFVSIDPSLRNTAIVWGTIENDELLPEGYELSITEKSKQKSVRASSDTVERCRKTIDMLVKVVKKVKPNISFCETPSGSQSSAAMKSYGVSCAYIAFINPPAIEVSPNELKLGSVGKKTASKKEIIEWAVKSFPNFKFDVKKDGTIKIGTMEHVADALAAAVSGMKTTQYKQLKRLIK